MSQPSYSDLLEEAAARGATPEQARLCAGRGAKMPEEELEPRVWHSMWHTHRGYKCKCGFWSLQPEARDLHLRINGEKPWNKRHAQATPKRRRQMAVLAIPFRPS